MLYVWVQRRVWGRAPREDALPQAGHCVRAILDDRAGRARHQVAARAAGVRAPPASVLLAFAGDTVAPGADRSRRPAAHRTHIRTQCHFPFLSHL